MQPSIEHRTVAKSAGHFGQIGKDALRHVLDQMGIAIDEAHRCREHQGSGNE